MPLLAPPDPVLAELQRVVDSHHQLHDEPLRLAVHYTPERDRDDLFLLEVVDGFGANQVTDERDFFEVGFPLAAPFPVAAGGQLRLVLANPPEFAVAGRDGWAKCEEFRRAVRAGRFTVIYADPDWQDWEGRLDG